MCRIPLTNGHWAIVDRADFDLVAHKTWNLHRKGRHHRYAECNERRSDGDGYRTIGMHRLIVGARPGMDVDHVNHDGLDNRRANLRECARSENLRNQANVRISKTSAYKGVHRRSNGKWTASISAGPRDEQGHKTIHLGTFVSERAAAEAYDARALIEFDPFALTNFKGKK